MERVDAGEDRGAASLPGLRPAVHAGPAPLPGHAAVLRVLSQGKRKIDRAYYVRHNADRLGEPTGRKPGQANAAEFQTVALADRIAECNERTRQELARLPRQLARTCPFCRMLVAVEVLHATERCSLDREPDDSGGCDAWEPRYRVDDDE